MRRAGLLALLLLPSLAHADGFGPFPTPAAPTLQAVPAPGARGAALAVSPFFASFRFYQSVLSPIDGPRCSHRPTCSLYAIQAMRKHPLLGSFLALDRLWRGSESSALRPLPIGEDAGGLHFIDPVEESDFWLR